MIQAIIFDLDGLLVDSTPIQREATRIFLESFGKIYVSESGREGMRIIDIIRELKDIYDLEGSLPELYRQRQDIFFELARRDLQLFSGASNLLTKIRKRGITIALATSGDRDYVNLMFKKFSQIKEFFTVVTTSEEVVRGKPDPDVYQKTAQKLGYIPSVCVVIEDSINGILAAKRAGMQVICVPNNYYPDQDYSLADRIFDNLEQVADAIASI